MENEKHTPAGSPPVATEAKADDAKASPTPPASDGVPHLYGAPIAAAPASESLFDLARGA